MTKIYDATEHREDFFIAVKDGKMGLIDKNDEPLTEFIYDYYANTEDHMFCGICNKIIPMKYKGKWGVLDSNCNKIADFIYDDIFCNCDYSFVTLNNKKGVINNNGKLIVEIKYDDIEPMEIGCLSRVRITDKFGYIEHNGKEVIEAKYDYLFHAGWGLILACKDGLTGIIDEDNNIVIDFKYELDTRMGFYGRIYSLAKLNGKYGIINKQGKTLMSFIYDDIEIDNTPIIAKIGNNRIKIDI